MTTIEATFDGDHLRLYRNGRRIRLAFWTLVALTWVAVVRSWRGGW